MFKKIALSLLTAVLVASSYIGVVTAQSSSSSAPGLMPRGSVGLPGMYFAGDRDTGLFWPGADTVAIASAGAERVRISSAGDVGIGALLPGARLNVDSGASPLVANINSSNASGAYVRWQGSGVSIGDIGSGANIVSGGGVADFGMAVRGANSLLFATGSLERVRITGDGTVLIGTVTDSIGALDVNGVIRHNGTQAYWLKGTTTFTTGSGTYTVPAGVRAIKVRAAGGGGGGGYARARIIGGAKAASGGGSGGAYFETWLTGLPASYAYAVGAAGAGGVAGTLTAPTAGGNTTFGASLTALGGGAGQSVDVITATQSFAGPGAASAPSANVGAQVNIGDSSGSPAWNRGDAANGFSLSVGGGNPVSAGGHTGDVLASDSLVNGVAGTGCGAGGSGAGAWRNLADQFADGGAGTAGCIIIEEYF